MAPLKPQPGGSLAETHPHLVDEVDGWDPKTMWAGSYKKMGWICKQGHRWEASISNRTRNSTGCPYCANRAVLIGFNDLATTHPDLASEADGWDPKTFAAGSHSKMPWKCTKGHHFVAIVKNRSKIGTGCPFCANKKVLVGFNDLATTHPDLALEADGWDPRTVIAGSHKKVKWKCGLGHQWTTEVVVRTQGFTCPYCSNFKVLVGFNDLATTHPDLALEADGWDPRTVIAGSHKKVKWKCGRGHQWIAKPNNRSSINKSSCPSCVKYGFDPNKNGWLYFIENSILEMFQVGISNVVEDRLSSHFRGGWELIEVRGPMDGWLTQQIELAVLRSIEKRGAVLGHKAKIKKFDGYSEAWTKDSLRVDSIRQLLDWVYEDEGLAFQ
jgi:hypothetical protein